VTTNPRKRRRIRRRIRRAIGATTVAALTATALLVLPAGAANSDHYAATADQSLSDIQAFWAKALPPTYGRTYKPIPTDRVYPYSAKNPPPGCGTRGTTPYQEVAGNAFYCEEGDFIAYDEQGLIPALRAKYGDVAVGLVLAHEMGHAIQARAGAPDGAFVYIELQADCFAGAWAQHVASGSGTDLRMSSDDLDRALAGFIDLRDPSGVDGSQNGAHGNAFDRVSAFQDGLVGGASACRGYETNPPEVTEQAFVSAQDQAINGDLPLDEVLPLLKKSLDTYWNGTVKAYGTAPELVASRTATVSCPGRTDGGVLSDTVVYCADSNSIVYAAKTLQKASDEIGDLGAGVFVATAWASAVQSDLGYKLGSNQARAASECLTGAWAGDVQRGTGAARNQKFSLSPGDLDEVVATFVATDGAQSKVDRGSVFDRVTLFREGFANGAQSCLTT
jgi:predicted metalloprotease